MADEVACVRPFTEIFIGEFGQIKPCPFFDRELGWLENDGSGLRDSFFGSEFSVLRQAMSDPNQNPCPQCPLKQGFFKF